MNDNREQGDRIALDDMPEPFNSFTELDMEELCRLVKRPFRVLHQVTSKGQARELASQLLIRNLALQKRVAQLTYEIAVLRGEK